MCLHRADDPLVCPKGHVFCKQCVYESLIAQKDAYQERLAKWESQEVCVTAECAL